MKEYLNHRDSSDEKNRLLGIVWAYSTLGLYKNAVSECKKLINIDLNDPSSYMELAMCYKDAGKIEKAIKYYGYTIKRFPEYSCAYVNLGYIFEKHKKRNDMAIVCYEKASELDPDDEWSLNNIGAILSKEGKWENALSYYKRAYNVNKQNDHILHNLGWAHYHCKNYKKAWLVYNDLVNKHPDNAAMHSDFGCVAYRIGDYRKALNLFEKALSMKPNDRCCKRLWKMANEKMGS